MDVESGVWSIDSKLADKMVDVNGVLGMVKYAATRSGSINM